MRNDFLTPPALREGDKIAILAPATTVKSEYVAGAAEMLHALGFDVEVMPSALGPADGSYAAPFSQRLYDLLSALSDPSVKCIFCARGGYGCVQLIPHIPLSLVRDNPKWLIGFSDISALHALWMKAGVKSLHAPMTKHLTLLRADDLSSAALIRILRGDTTIGYRRSPSPFNRLGSATGRLMGGNLAVLNGLAATPFDILSPKEAEGSILFLEDISEAIYAVERMLLRLNMAGTLHSLRGLIIGQFTEYHPDLNFRSMEEMISNLLDRVGINNIPVAFGFPTGHVDHNVPLIEGEPVSLAVTVDGVTLSNI